MFPSSFVKFTGALAIGLALACSAGSAQAQSDLSPEHRSHCVAIGFELGDRVIEMQKALDSYKTSMGDNPTAEQTAELAELKETVDNIDTMGGGLVAMYFDGEHFPSDADLAAAKAATLSDLVDQANTCIND